MASVLVVRALDQFLFLLLLQTIAILVVAGFNITVHPHCQKTCGNVSIPYPFGIGPECYRDKSFEITCKENKVNGVLMPYYTDYPLSDLSVSQSQATISMPIAYDCYNGSGLVDSSYNVLDLNGTPFVVSSVRNKFTAIGCNTMAYFSGNRASPIYDGGCMTFCQSGDMHVTNNCSGTGGGCCQTSLPENLDFYELGFAPRNTINKSTIDTTWKYNPCSYSFVAENFKFDVSYPKKKDFRSELPDAKHLGVDWFVKNATCEEAMKNFSSYACRSSHSECRNHSSTNGINGYTCNCLPRL